MSRGRVFKRAPAIVLGLNPNGLGLVKSLVRHGIPVVAIDKRPLGWRQTHTWMSSKTRLCEKIFLEPDCTDADIVAALLEVAARSKEAPVVLPSGDSQVYLLLDRKEELDEVLRFHVPDRATLDLLMMKGQFQRFCEEHSIPTPPTRLNVDSKSVGELATGIRYPCLVKAELRDARWDRLFSADKLLTADNFEELLDCVRRAEETELDLMLQEVIPGADDQLYFSHAYYSSDRRLVGMWTGRKVRQHPLHFGTSTFVETIDVPEVARITEQIAEALNLVGYMSIEFKKDPRDGSYRLLEVTPARSWYPHYLGAVAGVNLPYLWYKDLVGEPLPSVPAPQPPDGVAWVDEYRDLIAGIEAVREGEISFGQWMESYIRVRGFALTSLRDPLPGLFIVLRIMMSALNAVKRRFGLPID